MEFMGALKNTGQLNVPSGTCAVMASRKSESRLSSIGMLSGAALMGDSKDGSRPDKTITKLIFIHEVSTLMSKFI